MEPNFIHYLKQIIKTLVVFLVWMTINIKFGILDDYAFYNDKVQLGNIIFYAWLVISSVVVIVYLIKLWKEKYKQNNQELD